MRGLTNVVNSNQLKNTEDDIRLQNKCDEIWNDIQSFYGERASYDQVFKYLIKRIAKLEIEVFKPNSEKYILDKE